MRTIALLLLALLLRVSGPANAADWGPWTPPPAPAAAAPPALQPLRSGVRFFQRFISPVDGPRCPMYPTCSAYALQALGKHGPLIGAFATVDRLLHESGPAFRQHPVKKGDRIRFLDRLQENDFWFAAD